ncbi:hypothetical protein B0O99DRAFT_645496 [Bisporella sp. PMI_857]|nr:hypothetical protein B0O99DRAFT_645496 [Bisporella sp. PMI_857]
MLGIESLYIAKVFFFFLFDPQNYLKTFLSFRKSLFLSAGPAVSFLRLILFVFLVVNAGRGSY